MTTITINTKKNVIEMNNTFAKAAMIFGSDEYKALQEARRDYPNFRIITKNATKKRDTYKGLTFKKMEEYIAKHDEDGTIMATFKDYCGTSDEAKEMGIEALSYGAIKAWFLETYPEIERFYSKRNNEMNAVRKSREAKRLAAKEIA